MSSGGVDLGRQGNSSFQFIKNIKGYQNNSSKALFGGQSYKSTPLKRRVR